MAKMIFMTKPDTEGSPYFVISKIEIPYFSKRLLQKLFFLECGICLNVENFMYRSHLHKKTFFLLNKEASKS